MYSDDIDACRMFQDARLEDFRRYFQYRLSTGNFAKQSGVWTEWKNMLCLFQDETGQQVDLQIRIEMHGLLHKQFPDEYGLDLTAREKPVMSVEDLLVTLHHLWAFDRSTFPVERQRVQLALLLLVIAYTSSRPGALVEAACAAGTNECLTYNDVRLLIIPNPEEPARNVVVMEVTLLFTKGNRQTKKPTTYLFHEREDNLALCPILHFLALALADQAFEAAGTATDAERNQVLGHTRSEIFLRHYIQQQVRADVQSAYLGMPARQALFKAVGRMSLDRDPRVPQSLTDEQKAEVRRDPELVALTRKRSSLRGELIRAHSFLKNATGTPGHTKFLRLGRTYDSIEKTLLSDRLTKIKTAFFEAIDTKEVEAQLQSGLNRSCATDGELLATAIPTHAFEERLRLAVDLFRALKIKDSDGSTCRARRCGAINDMAALTVKRETPRQNASHLQSEVSAALMSELKELDTFNHEDEPDLFPIMCPSTVCLFCLGNKDITAPSRTYSDLSG
ncbi:MAG: hypothetical protein Q9159_005918 [Coniocarpon cinnabarinum]